MKPFIVHVKLYLVDIVVQFGEPGNLLKFLSNKNIDEEEFNFVKESIEDEEVKGRTYHFKCKALCIYLKEFPGTPPWKNLLAHEIFHATRYLMEDKQMPLDDNNEEAYAYLTGYITEQIYAKLDKIKKD